jgi:predicted RNase H-like HicB family nuclease
MPSDNSSEIKRLKGLPYRREILPQDDGTWFARIVEFPGCMTVGATREDANTMLDDAMTEWLSVMLEDKSEIPSPLELSIAHIERDERNPKVPHEDLPGGTELRWSVSYWS